MTNPKTPFPHLRKKAERLIRAKELSVDISDPENIPVLIHDLHVHQVELELQNNELLQTQRQLEMAKEKYYQLFNQAPVGYISVDEAGIIMKSNQAFLDMLDYPFSSLNKRPLIQFIVQDDRNTFLGLFRQYSRHRQTGTFDVRLETSEKKIIDVQLNIKSNANFPINAKEDQSTLIAITDISEKKSYQTALQQHKKRLNTIIEDIPAMICRFNPRGNIIFSNTEFDRYYTIAVPHHPPPNFFHVLPRDRQESIFKTFLDLTPERPLRTFELSLDPESPNARWQRWTIRALFGPRSKADAFQAVGRDISEEIQNQQEKEEKEKLQSLVELAGAVCHELRQPLQVIIGQTELIALDAEQKRDITNDIKQLKGQIHRINGALNQLDHITRYRTKPYVGDAKIIDLNQSCERRRHQRHTVSQTLSIEFKDIPQVQAPILDISAGGVSFQPCRGLEDAFGDKALTCRIMDPGNQIMVDRLTGYLIPADPVKPIGSRLPPPMKQALQFTPLEGPQLQAMERLIKDLSVAPNSS